MGTDDRAYRFGSLYPRFAAESTGENVGVTLTPIARVKVETARSSPQRTQRPPGNPACPYAMMNIHDQRSSRHAVAFLRSAHRKRLACPCRRMPRQDA